MNFNQIKYGFFNVYIDGINRSFFNWIWGNPNTWLFGNNNTWTWGT